VATISNIEIFFLLTIIAISYDLYRIYCFHLPHYQHGIELSSGTSPWAGSDEFPSNYKMVYKSSQTLYKFVGPTSLVFRYNYDFSNIKNLFIIKGVGELKNGEILFFVRLSPITPVSICLFICLYFLFLGRVPDAQEIFGTIVALFLGVSYLYYCRMAAFKLPKIVADKIAESIKS